MTTKYYDIIIIGAGISGLYSAYNIKKIDPTKTFLILESNRKNSIGGRVGNYSFYGTDVVIGAGVGRKDKDELLIDLLDELKIHYQPFEVNMNYSVLINNPINVKKILFELRSAYKNMSFDSSLTFKQFAEKYLGETQYKQFVISSGFSDYEDEDVFEVLYHYQMDDNAPGWTGLSIPWSKLINKLCDKIGMQNIKTTNKVEKVIKLQDKPCLYEISTEKGQIYYSHKVIIATRISTTQKLVPNGIKEDSIYQQIHGQPFLYVYAKFTKSSSEIMKKYVPYYTIVPGPLQKMIPMDANKGVYMIAYVDNKNAIYLKPHLENTEKNRYFFERQLEAALGIENGTLEIISIKDFYWPIGTHYYEPLDKKKFKSRTEFIKKAQHPENCMLVVGEAVSRRQGWTEGALESVHSVLNKEWISS